MFLFLLLLQAANVHAGINGIHIAIMILEDCGRGVGMHSFGIKGPGEKFLVFQNECAKNLFKTFYKANYHRKAKRTETTEQSSTQNKTAGQTAPQTTTSRQTAPQTTTTGQTASQITSNGQTVTRTTTTGQTVTQTTTNGQTVTQTTTSGQTAPQTTTSGQTAPQTTATGLTVTQTTTTRQTVIRTTTTGQTATQPTKIGQTVPQIDRNKRKAACRKCLGCTKNDCGECVNCLAKSKFGGPNKRRRRCIQRVCARS